MLHSDLWVVVCLLVCLTEGERKRETEKERERKSARERERERERGGRDCMCIRVRLHACMHDCMKACIQRCMICMHSRIRAHASHYLVGGFIVRCDTIHASVVRQACERVHVRAQVCYTAGLQDWWPRHRPRRTPKIRNEHARADLSTRAPTAPTPHPSAQLSSQPPRRKQFPALLPVPPGGRVTMRGECGRYRPSLTKYKKC